MNRNDDCGLPQERGSPLAAVLSVCAIAVCLLFGAPKAQAASDLRPANREEARAIIAKADAKAQAEMIAALEKEQSPLEREWGIKLMQLNRIAAGYMLTFKYKILDPEKAKGMVQRKHSPDPYVIVEKSGAKLMVPFSAKVGSLRSSVKTASQIHKGRNYFVMFANPGKHVDSGDKVTVVIGDFKLENVIVR